MSQSVCNSEYSALVAVNQSPQLFLTFSFQISVPTLPLRRLRKKSTTPRSRSTTSSALSVSRAPPSTRRASLLTSRVCITSTNNANLVANAGSGYMKGIEKALTEKGAPESEITAFKTGAQKYVKEKLLPNFKDFEFYTGESMDPDGM